MLLIIEDTQKHQAAARVQFPEARVVNYDEAYKLLRDARPGDFSAILTDLHFKVERSREIPPAPFVGSYPKNMAAIGTELPFGLAFVLKGIELGTPVALFTDTDHHEDLVTGLLDIFSYKAGYYRPPRGEWKEDEQRDRIPNPRFLLVRSDPMAKDMYWDGSKIVCEPMPPTPDFEDQEAWKAHWEKPVKDWREAFRQLSELVPASA